MPEEIVYTREEVQAKIDAIYATHPYLKDRELTSDCKCCEWLDIKDEYGFEAGGAWEDLESWKWLLGE